MTIPVVTGSEYSNYESISGLTYKFTRILLVPYQQGSTLRIGEEPVDESGEGLERTRHGASCSASSEREDEPGKSLSGPPGSLLPELPQAASLNRARTCRGGEALVLALMLLPVLCRLALRSSSGASACNGMQNGDQNTGTN